MIAGPTRSWWPLLAVTVLLVLVGGAAAVATPQVTRLPVPSLTRDARPAETTGGPTPTRSERQKSQGGQAARLALPSWLLPLLGGVLSALVVGGLLAIGWLMAKGRLRSRPGRVEDPPAAPGPAAEQVVAAVDAGLGDLADTDLDPRRAVIACWLRLEQVAAAAGTPRQLADTPTDLVTRLLAAHHTDPAVLAEFAEIYRRARYATHTVDERMREQARAALERVRTALTGVSA